ncbi:hypothetical protein EDC01DRAFT_776800 [Geopyxis carbonaria]|nr:hypothetical protein EDC01DRAFT_776800 [Geopyxis carbonaria]
MPLAPPQIPLASYASPSSSLANHCDPAPAASSSIDPSAAPSKNSPCSTSESSSDPILPFAPSEHKPPDSCSHPADSTAPSTTTAAAAPSPSLDPSLLDPEELEATLRKKRTEIEHEIEAFRLRKEAEYRDFETSLRTEAKAKEKRPREDASSRDNGAAAATAQAATAVETASTKQGSTGGGNSGEQVPLDLGGSLLEDNLKQTLQKAQAQEQEQDQEDNHYYPPFEQELQVAGLFAPTFLPLLDSRYRHMSPPASPKMANSTPVAAASNTAANNKNDSTPAAATTVEQSVSKPASISTSRYSKDSPPTLPLASSLKSAASSSSLNNSSPGSNSDRLPPKSPKKRVTFHFEDDSYVPSRSSPPKNKVVWKLGIADNNDDDFEEIDDDEDDDDDEGADHAEHVEDVKGAARGSYYQTEDLDDDSYMDDDRGTVEQGGPDSVGFVSPSTTSQGSIFSAKSPFADLPSNKSATEMSNGTASLLASMNAQSNTPNDDDDDDGLFDLDETIPDEPENSPPHRDISPMVAATQLAPINEGLSSSKFSLPSSLRGPFTAPSVPVPSRASPRSSEPLTFGKSPLAASSFSAGQPMKATSALSASFTQPGYMSAQNRQSATTIASSLPAASHFAAALDSTRFRRRSINKYIPSPPPEEAEEADNAVNGRGDPSTDPVLSPYASSVPVGITPRLDSIRSPPASTSPATKPKPSSIPDASPLSARPSPTNDAIPDSVKALAESPPPTTTGDELDSYRKTDRFFSASSAGRLASPYRTKFAQEVAERAMRDGDAGLAESVVGGLDGGTGPDPSSFSLRRGSVRGSVGGVGSGGFSLSQRMAMEDGVV